MACLTKKMIAEIPHECAKSKAFTMKLGDLPNMVDAVFDGDHKEARMGPHVRQRQGLRSRRWSVPASAY